MMDMYAPPHSCTHAPICPLMYATGSLFFGAKRTVIWYVLLGQENGLHPAGW